MKFLVYIACFVCIVSGAYAQKKKPVVINGNVLDTKEGSIYIRPMNNAKFDTVKIVNNKFSYKTSIAEPIPFLLNDEKNQYQLLFIDGGKVDLTMNKNNMQLLDIAGAPSNDIFKKLVNAQQPLQAVAQKIQQDFQIPGANQDSMKKAMDGLNVQLQNNFLNFLKENSNSIVAAYVVYSSIANDRAAKASTSDMLSANLGPKAKESFYGKELAKLTAKLKAIEVGSIAPDFTLPSPEGKNYTLSAQRGHYTLVDFWASWCGPCKGEIPYMKTAYEKYHSKGFEIISVSLDDKKEKWLDALKQFQMPWIHISDVKGFSSKVNELYYVPSIPKTLLLDANGVIIATDLRGPALDSKLSEFYK